VRQAPHALRLGYQVAPAGFGSGAVLVGVLAVSNLAAILLAAWVAGPGAAQAAIPAVELAVEVAPGEAVANRVVYPAAAAS
jgi:hypothetical protein